MELQRNGGTDGSHFRAINEVVIEADARIIGVRNSFDTRDPKVLVPKELAVGGSGEGGSCRDLVAYQLGRLRQAEVSAR
ncbi:hypothetical protein NDU88_006240 [Pleurodeles waltl]|uniref:Uncharacterized protein n=1 Tax=Pleurodeles waltl TaxID=8319 RepID=A0AAV7UME2_PLEWA|nr:hypothetical protein NDU88_006240 [Pleurodeles waltl]